MKNLLRKITVLLVTFVIGVSAYSVWYKYNPTSLCDIEKHPQLYMFGDVHLRAVFVRTEFGIQAISFCGNVSGAGIELAPDEIAKLSLPVSTYSKNKTAEQIYYMDAVIVGQMDSYIGMGCFGPKYNIKNVRIERVISIREFEDSDKAIEWAKSNSY